MKKSPETNIDITYPSVGYDYRTDFADTYALIVNAQPSRFYGAGCKLVNRHGVRTTKTEYPTQIEANGYELGQWEW